MRNRSGAGGRVLELNLPRWARPSTPPSSAIPVLALEDAVPLVTHSHQLAHALPGSDRVSFQNGVLQPDRLADGLQQLEAERLLKRPGILTVDGPGRLRQGAIRLARGGILSVLFH